MSRAHSEYNQKGVRIKLRSKYDRLSECSVCHKPIKGNWKVCWDCSQSHDGQMEINRLKKRAMTRAYSSTSNLFNLIKRNEEKLRGY